MYHAKRASVNRDMYVTQAMRPKSDIEVRTQRTRQLWSKIAVPLTGTRIDYLVDPTA